MMSGSSTCFRLEELSDVDGIAHFRWTWLSQFQSISNPNLMKILHGSSCRSTSLHISPTTPTANQQAQRPTCAAGSVWTSARCRFDPVASAKPLESVELQRARRSHGPLSCAANWSNEFWGFRCGKGKTKSERGRIFWGWNLVNLMVVHQTPNSSNARLFWWDSLCETTFMGWPHVRQLGYNSPRFDTLLCISCAEDELLGSSPSGHFVYCLVNRFLFSILTYLHTYILTYLHTYILTYLHTYIILTYLHNTYILA